MPPGVLFGQFWAPASECPKECFLSAFWRFLGLKNAKKHSKSTLWGTPRQVPKIAQKALRGALSGPGPKSTPVNGGRHRKVCHFFLDLQSGLPATGLRKPESPSQVPGECWEKSTAESNAGRPLPLEKQRSGTAPSIRSGKLTRSSLKASKGLQKGGLCGCKNRRFASSFSPLRHMTFERDNRFKVIDKFVS